MKQNDHMIVSVLTRQKPSPECYDISPSRKRRSAIHHSDTIEECRKKNFDDVSQWLLEDWISTLAEGGGAKKRFQYCVNPNSSTQFLCLRAIQGHSGESAIDLALQDILLIPKGFTEYLLHHVGNANEKNSF